MAENLFWDNADQDYWVNGQTWVMNAQWWNSSPSNEREREQESKRDREREFFSPIVSSSQKKLCQRLLDGLAWFRLVLLLFLSSRGRGGSSPCCWQTHLCGSIIRDTNSASGTCPPVSDVVSGRVVLRLRPDVSCVFWAHPNVGLFLPLPHITTLPLR